MSNLQDFLPRKDHKNTRLIQARIPTEIVDEVRKVLSKKNLTWAEVLSACLRLFLAENGVRLK